MGTAERVRRRLGRVAHHEAGHAVIAYRLGLPIRRVTIRPDAAEGTLGHMLYAPVPDSLRPDVAMSTRVRLLVEGRIICCFAGGEAEAKLAGRRDHVGAGGDYRNAIDLAGYICGPDTEETEAYLKWLSIRARRMVDGNWKLISHLAAMLLERETLSGRACRRVIHDAIEAAVPKWTDEQVARMVARGAIRVVEQAACEAGQANEQHHQRTPDHPHDRGPRRQRGRRADRGI